MNLSGKYLLVTGGGGFIGSHLLERLLAQGCRVRAFLRYTSRSSRGWIENFPKELQDRIEVVFGDLKDPDIVRKAVDGCDVVFHLAALIGIPFSYSNPRDYVDTNIVGTTNILSACRDCRIERLVHISTSEVYGSAQYTPIDEKHPRIGQSPYSASKIAADMMVESFQRSFGLPAVIIRPFNTFGPRQSERAVIPTIISQLLTGNKVRLGSTLPTRDFTYVNDTVNGIIRGAEVDDTIGKTINLGSGSEISIGELVGLVANILEKDFEIISEKIRVRPETSEVERLISDNSAAGELLGWSPQVSLRDGLEISINWYRQNLTTTRPREYIT